MEKLNLIGSVQIWIDMRSVRNRIVHEYLPEAIKDIYDLILNQYGRELKEFQEKIAHLNI